MCEPAHSIVQYPERPSDDDERFGGNVPMDSLLKSGLGKAMSWGKKIGSWFHFSKLGSGHSEAIELSGQALLILPEHTRYEGLWWERRFIIDGPYHGQPCDRDEALEVAEMYHQRSVMQNMSSFRRFFEQSVFRSDRSYGYVRHLLEDVMNADGRDAVTQRLRRVFGRSMSLRRLFGYKSDKKERATKVIMGFTRQRNLFLPHWADDSQLWTPG